MSEECRDWLATLWPGSYKGVPFYYESADMAGGRGLVIHEFPNRDDPYIEDLGEAPRIFEGAAYLAQEDVDRAGDALDATLASRGAGMLVDPVKGPVMVHCQEFKRRHDLNKLGFLAYSVKFVRAGAPTALISVPLLGRLVIAGGDALAQAVAGLFSSAVVTVGQPDFVASAAGEGVAGAAGAVEALRLAVPSDPAISARVRDAVAAIAAAAPDLLGRRSPAADVLPALIAAVPDFDAELAPAGGAGVIAGALVGTVRLLAAGMAPEAAQSAMADFIGAHADPAPAVAQTKSAELAAANAAEARRLARLAGLIAWAEALQRRRYPSRPDGVTARGEAAERFEIELNACDGAANAALFIAIETLRGRLVGFLTQLIADLAPVVTVEAGAVMPSLWWAWRLYADPARAGELVARNAVRHPSFMPQKFVALER